MSSFLSSISHPTVAQLREAKLGFQIDLIDQALHPQGVIGRYFIQHSEAATQLLTELGFTVNYASPKPYTNFAEEWVYQDREITLYVDMYRNAAIHNEAQYLVVDTVSHDKLRDPTVLRASYQVAERAAMNRYVEYLLRQARSL